MNETIKTIGLTKLYPGHVVGVEDLSLSVNEGEIFGFLGSNGAGKTTTIRMLVNLLFPTGGSATIFGKDSVKHHLDICREIGYLPSAVCPHRYMTGQEFLEYMGRLSGKSDREYRHYLLKRFDFSEKDIKRKIKQYSTGMARKIALVQTLQSRPRVMILDEPTEGLDPVMQHIFYELLKEYRDNGGTVFLSSHHLPEVEQVCDRVAIIRNGRLVALENIHDLVKRMTRSIHVTFKHDVSASLLKSPAWDITGTDGLTVHARLTGDMDTLIKLLSQFEVQDMSLLNSSLQDVFLDYYRVESNGRDEA